MHRLVNEWYGQKSTGYCLLFDIVMVLTPTTRNIKYLEALKDAIIGKIGNFRRGADNIRTRVWNNMVELTTTTVEIERAKLEALQNNAKDSDLLSQEGANHKQDSNDMGAIDRNSALAAVGLIVAALKKRTAG